MVVLEVIDDVVEVVQKVEVVLVRRVLVSLNSRSWAASAVSRTRPNRIMETATAASTDLISDGFMYGFFHVNVSNKIFVPWSFLKN